MADLTPVIASAVVLPESAAPPESTRAEVAHAPDVSLKRRASGGSEDAPKRRKLSNETVEDEESQQARRKSRQLEEKRRGQRLFGALLGTISQGKTNAAQKRREDIEKRQREKLLAQSAEDATRQRERLAQLRATRKAEQNSYDEDTLRLKHANMRHYANLLTTKAEPRLYYKPRKLTREQEDQIDRQVKDTERAIAQELQEFAEREVDSLENREREQERPSPTYDVYPTRTRAEQAKPTADESASEGGAGEQLENANHHNSPNKQPQHEAEIQRRVSVDRGTDNEEEMKDAEELDGELVVEAGEDTVIY